MVWIISPPPLSTIPSSNPRLEPTSPQPTPVCTHSRRPSAPPPPPPPRNDFRPSLRPVCTSQPAPVFAFAFSLPPSLFAPRPSPERARPACDADAPAGAPAHLQRGITAGDCATRRGGHVRDCGFCGHAARRGAGGVGAAPRAHAVPTTRAGLPGEQARAAAGAAVARRCSGVLCDGGVGGVDGRGAAVWRAAGRVC